MNSAGALAGAMESDDEQALKNIVDEVAVGNPAAEILAHADEVGPELVVVGSHNKGPTSTILLGSLSSEVIRRSKLPALVLKTSASNGRADSMKTVLFVCVGNSARSQIAEGFFNYFTPPGWQALSAGTAPASSISKDAVSVMKEKDIDISDGRPKLLSEDMLKNADHIVSMGCGVDLCPYELYEGVVDWAVDDPKGMVIEDLRRVRDEIEKKVKDLIRTLA